MYDPRSNNLPIHLSSVHITYENKYKLKINPLTKYHFQNQHN